MRSCSLSARLRAPERMLISFDIERIEPLADGAPFGAVGAYERVIGKAKGEVDPDASRQQAASP